METIIAALIIACSNLVQPAADMSSANLIEIKKQCITRVSSCATKELRAFVTSPTSLLNECSGKVY